MMEAFRISKVSDLMGNQSISELTSKLFEVRGIKCDKALISDMFKKVCPESRDAQEESDEFVTQFMKVINCFFE